jgi:hypothetical protein
MRKKRTLVGKGYTVLQYIDLLDGKLMPISPGTVEMLALMDGPELEEA